MDDSTQKPIVRDPYHRISKACQECRRRKIKCNGLPNCKNCTNASVTCTYRSMTRLRRLGLPSATHRSRDPSYEAGVAPDDPLPPRHPVEDTSRSSVSIPVIAHDHPSGTTGINSSISATHVASTSCILQLYYGASSNFSFLQQIHHCLTGDVGNHGPNDDVREGGAELDICGQRALYFGTHDTNKHQHSAQIGDRNLMLLSESLANRFLLDYLDTFFQIMPFASSHELSEKVKQLFASPNTNSLSNDDTGCLMVVLAIGATMKEDSGWAEMLVEKAKTIANTISHVVNLKAHAHYETISGRPNSAYLYLGTGVRKAFAAGLHRDTPTHKTLPSGLPHDQERRMTIWCLYFFESLTCFSMGRPGSMSRDDISSPYPENEPFISSFIKLASIMSSAAKSMYSSRQSSLLDMYRKAQFIRQELRDHAFEVHERLGIVLGQSTDSNVLSIRPILLQILYWNTLILTYRPFLIAHVNYQKKSSAHGNGGVTETIPWLEEACAIAVGSARDLIRFLALAIDQNTATRGLRLFSYYLEGACFLLIYDTLRDWNAKEPNLSGVKTGLYCLSKLVSGSQSKTNIFSIQRLLTALDNIDLGRNDRISERLSDAVPSLPQDFQAPATAGVDNSMHRSVIADLPFETLLKFPAGWATFEDGCYFNQSTVLEPELCNPDLSIVNWEFDNFSVDDGVLY